MEPSSRQPQNRARAGGSEGPGTRRKGVGSMATISLCMIVKDEEAVIGRILGQMRGIADEILIGDTGSQDRTKEIAAEYADLVFDVPWNDDFGAARNAVCARAAMDYWMWLDADDVVEPSQQALLLKLKESLDTAVDVVMMKYLTGFDGQGRPTFSYYRERLLKNRAGFFWEGRVHEAVTPRGKILYSPIEIRHQKEKPGDPGRNLRIYEDMIARGEAFDPRHRYYYGRELAAHSRFQEAAQVFQGFLDGPGGWKENKIDACLQLSRCLCRLGDLDASLKALFQSFLYDSPRAEICCEAGGQFLKKERYSQAAYWYGQALSSLDSEASGAFTSPDCHNYIPAMQLCVCHDRMGDYETAYRYHRMAQALKPEDPAVLFNEAYFKERFGWGAEK